MLSNDRSETSFELWAHAVAAVDANDAAAISVSEMNFGVPTGLINLTYLEASRPKRADSMSKRSAHHTLLLATSAISAASARP
jgi:hypothetical protein